MIDLHFKTLHEFEEFLKLFGRCCTPHQQKPLLIVGQGKVELKMFTINPGQTKTLTAVFKDANGVSHPLSAVPTCVDDQNVLVIAPVGTQTPSDASFSWTLTCPATATIAGGNVTVDGVNPDGTHDTGVDPYTVAALDDTVVDISVQ